MKVLFTHSHMKLAFI